jgi:RNA polymerase sigma-70 factor, ECF subfamily
MTEKDLITGVIAGDRASVTYLVETYQKKVIKTAYYFLGNMDDAEDTAQDVFMDILNSMKNFRQSSALSTWIYRITVNRSLTAVKRNRQRQLFTRIESIFGISGQVKNDVRHQSLYTSDPFEENETRQLLKDSLSGLPENQRIVFILSKYEELSYKEIAEVTGLTVSSVESLMHRAKLNLQKKLATYFSEYQKK